MRKNMKENRWKGCLVGRGRGGGEKMVRPSFFFFFKVHQDSISQKLGENRSEYGVHIFLTKMHTPMITLLLLLLFLFPAIL